MKKTIALITSFLAATILFAQATLPTSWSFSGNMPTGWTNSGMAYYTGSGNTPPAGKFDNTGDWLQINYNDDAGPLTYFLTGNSFTGGTFTVEESVNGTSWTTLHTHTAPPTVYTQFTDNPQAASRYIRFYYTQKVSGNIGVDDINLAVAPAGPQQEINVKFNNVSVASGSTIYFNSPVNTSTPVTLSIENLGTTNTLTLSATNFSGPQSAEYTIQSAPASINALSNSSLVFDFLPTSSGTRLATLTITNNDANEPSYIINLYGIGGSFASEPTASASNFNFGTVKSYRFSPSYTAANPAPDGGYLVLRKKGSAVTDFPLDGNSYTRGDYIGSSQVAYVGNGTSFSVLNIIASTAYHFAVFSFNGAGVYTNYFTSTPLTGNVTSAGNMMGTYYNGVATSQTNFVTTLHALINPHTSIFYGNYAPTIIDKFESRDTTGDKRVVTCVYTGFNDVYTPPFIWDTLSREHTFCHSWMPTYPADNPEKPEYNDQHHLFPTEFSNSNQVRSNHPLGEVVTIQQQFMHGKFGLDAQGNQVYEPRDEHKGDAARALFYMLTCYHTVSGNNWFLPVQQSQNVLKAWHWQDLPDSWEIARNDFLDSLQGNRNPFVDSVHFACYIDFYNMTKITNPQIPCNTIGVKEEKTEALIFDVFPNPSSGIINWQYLKNTSVNVIVSLTDVTGKQVFVQQTAVSSNSSNQQIDLTKLAKGIYMMRVEDENNFTVKKLILY